MNTIASGMENLIAQHRAYALSGQFSPGSVSWPWAGPANPDILAFYRHYNPVDVLIETGLTPLRFHNTATLAAAQTAYSPRGNEALPPAHWPVNSLVIMDDIGGGRPIIAELRSEQTLIWAQHEAGTLLRIAASLPALLHALAAMVDLIYGKYQIFEVFDADGEVSGAFSEDFCSATSPFLGAEGSLHFFEYLYG